MPYIPPFDRARLNDRYGPAPSTPGELNYLITQLCADYVAASGKSYATINEVVGVLECAKLELYRRVAAPYEDGKCEANGDVY